MFDQAENWLQFFTNPANKILEQRNVYILYPRNFGNSDRHHIMTWESHANDIARFMYTHRISMATLAGHGLGGKIALATACYHSEKVTGYIGLDSVPTNQYYFEPFHELRGYVKNMRDISLSRPFTSISYDLKQKIKCPKWRGIFESNVIKGDTGYTTKFDLDAVWDNIKSDQPSSLVGWHPSVGCYGGRVLFAFPDESRHVYLNTNTLPMLSVCPSARGFNRDIFSLQGDTGVQNHWIYERDEDPNAFAWRVAHFLRHYDGVHTLLVNRDEVGKAYIPDMQEARTPRPIPSDIKPAHYYHNWRFNNVYDFDTHKK